MFVVIVGAGIGGLTTALSLHQAGIRALVVDAAVRLRPLGLGINLLPHAVRELTELGLGDELAELGVATGEMVHFDRHGGRIWGEPRGRALGYNWPQYSIHRGELQVTLLDAVRARLGENAVRTGTVFEGFEQDGTRVRVRLLDRASGTTETVTADVLVGADGLHSAVRARLHPGEPAPLWNGIRMWRGVTEGVPFLTGRTLAVAGSNAAAKLVVYPISRRAERQGRALLNWVAEVKLADDRLDTTPNWNRTGRLEDVLPHFADWTFDWLNVPAMLAGSAEILEYPMVDRDPLDRWTSGRVTLLGDAAHPMYPIGSNGGSQAVLDARVLAHELARAADPAEGLLGYERERREKVNAIVLACRDMPADRILHTVSERAPDGFTAIEDVLTPDELSTITSAYRQTSFSDVESLNSRPSYSVSVR
ncbi:2-polyprenyl-6-methoxyphenol hydroxylase-like FAD-dependent oxidoreductase [Actinomadura pelletieri DSM 43383]|uniref:2-polyprenyl-6-methoxyphenol hydroxylase-like FAD-dependent oxidoreductase n=1 Tax=Actinomadura pelletieri DSM 43383 TaxID=1120940 RepID=A0A495QBG1_9ACTN|nr:flavin-dependent oxidoreductase [Actinomadura pelletieri]RKS68937.1 2-polyprenyl-6-methoxyphenol hydroxylase-like FAD-dependent oxidoreductase [Actinomadura pelletieri DSM 43383]